MNASGAQVLINHAARRLGSVPVTDTMKWLRLQVVYYRDKQITHQKNPRTLFTTFIDADGAVQLGTNYLYQREWDEQQESPRIDDVVTNLNVYVEQLIELIVSNRAKSRYNFRSS